MKRVVCGKDKGYLMPLKEFEDKIKQRIPLLKDKSIYVYFNRCVGFKTARIRFSEPDKKLADDIFLEGQTDPAAQSMIVSTQLLVEALGIDGNVTDIDLKIKLPGGKFGDAGLGDALIDNDNMFYFILIREPETVWIKEE
jgi:hypothetical protein